MIANVRAVQRVACAWCTRKLGIVPCTPDRADDTAYACCPECARRVRVRGSGPWWYTHPDTLRHDWGKPSPGRRQPHPRRRR